MNILAIETSSQACSVALSIDRQIKEKHQILNNQHSEFLLSFIDELLAESSINKSELDAIAVGNGPGSFTGLRLGMGVSQGLSYGLNKPLIPVSSLLAVAAQSNQNYLLVAVDARMGEVYWQCLEKSTGYKYVELTEASLSKPSEIKSPEIADQWCGVGSGWDVYLDQLQGNLQNSTDYTTGILPKASVVAKIAEDLMGQGTIDSNQHALPVYVRDKVTS